MFFGRHTAVLLAATALLGPAVLHAQNSKELDQDSAPPGTRAVEFQWHTEAADLLPKLFRRFAPKGLTKRDEQKPPEISSDSQAMFSADVRLVQLTLSATDREGRPVLGLKAEDFAVTEDGKPQRIDNVLSEEAPFNLVLLLDCSSTTEGERPAISEAARRFIGVARPNDRVAIHAFAQDKFLVLSRLTTQHEAAIDSLDVIAALGGGTPLYDSIVLSYADEISRLRGQRNAIVVLSDGLDNGIYDAGVPSVLSFSQLVRAAAEMDSLIYPVVLDPLRTIGTRPDALKWSNTVIYRAGALAKTTGGRVFHASSIQDLEPVYDQVAAELHSVYTLTYSPSNQDFDGQWRKVQAKVGRPRVTVRTRPGYYSY